MTCRSCQRHKQGTDLNATGFNKKTGKGKCPCGQSYMGAAIQTCPKHWNAGYKTPESVIKLLKLKEKAEKAEKAEDAIVKVEVAELITEEAKPSKKKEAKK